jgi:hypothetical protein
MWGYCYDKPDHVVKSLELVCERNLEKFGDEG